MLKNFGMSVAKQEKILKGMKMIVINEKCILQSSFIKKKTKAPTYYFKYQAGEKHKILPRKILLLKILDGEQC